MKNILMVMAFIVSAMACRRAGIPASTPIVNTEIKNANGQTMLAGRCSASMMQQGAYSEWFLQSQKNYTVDTVAAAELKPLLKHKAIEIFLGSWCGDSKREVPKMLKLLQAASFDTSSVHLIFVDNAAPMYKQSPQHEEAGKDIRRVPTIIVYERRKEIGRIVESPVVSLEKDLLAILLHKSYVPHYAKPSPVKAE